VSEARYAVGVDLGTTHCALSYVDLASGKDDEIAQAMLRLPQLTAPGAVEELFLLPSFLYLPHPTSLPPGTSCFPGAASRG